MAKIPSPKPYGIAHDAWSREGSKNKNSEQYLSNYDAIFRKKPKKRPGGHVTVIHKGGKIYELPNPSTHGARAATAWEKFRRETGGLHHHKLKALYE